MKHSTACTECRGGKRKCISATKNSRCHQCFKRQLNCSLSVGGWSLPEYRQQRRLVPVISQATLQPSQEVREELVALYVRHLHNKPHTLFHEPSLMEDVRNGSLSHNVLLAILGLAARYVSKIDGNNNITNISCYARFSTDPSTRSSGMTYAAEAKRSLKEGIDDICLQNIQACVLVGTICSADGDVGTESIYYGKFVVRHPILE